MSTVNVQPTANARSAVAYALYGTSGDRYQRFEDEDKDTRTKWYTCSMGEPKEIVARGRVQLSVYPSFCLKGLMHDE